MRAPVALTPGKHAASIRYQAVCSREPVWALLRRNKFLYLLRVKPRSPGSPACSLVTIPTKLLRPHLFSGTLSNFLLSLFEFYDIITVHRNRFLVNKTNKCTEIQFCWYYDSTCFGQPFCPSSGVLRRKSALVHFVKL